MVLNGFDALAQIRKRTTTRPLTTFQNCAELEQINLKFKRQR